MRIDWGDAPAWVAAVGTVGTLTVAVLVAWIQVLDRRRERYDRLATQARLVTAWVEQDIVSSTPPTLRVLVTNASPQAIYDIAIALEVGSRGRYSQWRNSLGPSETARIDFAIAGYPRGELSAPTLAFTDAAGRRWIRLDWGFLRGREDRDAERYLSDTPGSYESIAARDSTVVGLKHA